jgi:hypothetical protein
MHTVIVLALGFALLGVCTFAGRVLGGPPGTVTAALVFIPLWLIGAAINLYVGVKRAGYSIVDEAPIFALVFTIPAAVGLFVWWKLR